MEHETIYIDTGHLREHPDNPRKDMGDLSELADSIRMHGVMQNLTVVPDPEKGEGYYMVLIGHRRAAAATHAGLKTLPCIIEEDLDRREQLTIMLEENIQRNDLTITEQANGFQLMLDLGETVESIAEKTGFSKSTVYHRVNIAKLDQEILGEIEEDDSFQLTLRDLYELEKLEDVEDRNKILARATSSETLVSMVRDRVRGLMWEKNFETFEEKMKELGIKKAPAKTGDEWYGDKWKVIKEWDLGEDFPDEIELPKGAPAAGKLFYIKRFANMAYVIQKNKKEKHEPTKQELEYKQWQENQKHIREIDKRVTKRRQDFIFDIVRGRLKGPRESETLKDEIWSIILAHNSYCNPHQHILSFISDELFKKPFYALEDKEKDLVRQSADEMSVFNQLLLTLDAVKTNENIADYGGRYNEDLGEPMMQAFEILEKWGWYFEGDEERAVMDGSSSLYAK